MGHAILSFCLAVLAATVSAQAAPLRTGYDYQGRLSDGTMPVNGTFEFRFALFDAAVAGHQSAGPVTNANVSVTNGLFNTVIDFGADVFDGTQYWLEIELRPSGSATAFTTLVPRQLILPTPYALHAVSSAGVADAAIGNAALAPSAVSADKIAPRQVVKSLNGLSDDIQFSVEGDLLLRTERNQIVIAPAPASCLTYSNCYWNLLGNGNIVPGVNYLGTIAGELAPLEFRVNDNRSLLHVFTAANTAPNLIGGYRGNIVSGTGGTIAGGGQQAGINQVLANYGTVSGGYTNIIGAFSTAGTISGGHGNTIQNNVEVGTIGGGVGNILFSATYYPTIGGGLDNEVHGIMGGTIGGGAGNTVFGSHNTVAGGRNNTVTAPGGTSIGGGVDHLAQSDHATIGGGRTNWIAQNSEHGTISGGVRNAIGTNVVGGTIGGGLTNTIRFSSTAATIAGGHGNFIQPQAPGASIGGGRFNSVGTATLDATVGGGARNAIEPNSDSATIAGGSDNDIGPAGDYAVISGGSANRILGSSRMDVIAGGFSNTIGTNTVGAAIGGGTGNEIEAGASFGTVAGGGANTIRNGAFNGTIGGGSGNVIYTNIPYGTIPGGYRAAVTNYGQMAYASGHFANPGDAQTSVYVVRNTTSTNSAGVIAELFLDGATQRIRIPADSAWIFDVMVVGRTAGGNSAAYHFRGSIERNGAVTLFPAAPLLTLLNEDVAAWDAQLIADNANDALVVRVTGSVAAPVRWAATVRTTEVIYP